MRAIDQNAVEPTEPGRQTNDERIGKKLRQVSPDRRHIRLIRRTNVNQQHAVLLLATCWTMARAACPDVSNLCGERHL